MAKRLCRDKASAQDKGPRVLVAARARRGARGVSVTGSCMGRTPTTLTDPRTSMSVCLSGEPAIGPERTKALTSGARAARSLVRFGRRTALHGTMGTTVLALARNRRGLNAGNALGERESREALGRRRALAARGAHGRPGGVRAHATRARAWRASRARASDLTFQSVAKSGDLGHRHLLAK